MSQNHRVLRYRDESKIRQEGIMETHNLDVTFSAGGEAELEEAMRLYSQPLLRYCHNILCDYEEAKDVVQMTFIKAYEKRQSFRGGTCFAAWLYRIAYTNCMDCLRKKKWQIFWQVPKSKESNYISEELEEALFTLKPLERAIIFSRVIDEKSYVELEEIYGISASTLRKKYERAKKKLAKALKEANTYYRELEGRI